MIKKLGVIFKQPYCFLIAFEYYGEYYAVGTIYYNKHNTRDKELYDKYFFALFQVENFIYVKNRPTIIDVDIINETKPLAHGMIPFKSSFSKEALEKNKEGILTKKAQIIYEQEENQWIQRLTFSKVFNKEHQTELYEMLFS